MKMPDVSSVKNFLSLELKLFFILSQIRKNQFKPSQGKLIPNIENFSLKARLTTCEINVYKSLIFTISKNKAKRLSKIYFFMSRQFINLKKVIEKEKEYFPESNLNHQKRFSVVYVFYSTNYRIHYFYYTNHET